MAKKITVPKVKAVKQKKEGSETKEKANKKGASLEEIESYFSDKYEFIFNDIKQKPEYKTEEMQIFRPVDKYFVNSLKRELSIFGLRTSVQTLKELLSSEFSPRINPIKQYFIDLPLWDGTDHIKSLANTIKVKNNEDWPDIFKKWVVACVANVFSGDKCANHTCLVIAGPQGCYKTTWLENLCPKILKRYLYSGKINPENKDSLTLLAEMFLINIDDQLKQLNKKDENDIKSIITINSIQYRRPYDEFINDYQRIASFCGSVNGIEFLTDTTGNRRFLPFEAIEIDIKKAILINIDSVWSQAYKLFNDQFVYWFSPEEIQEIEKSNSLFRVTSAEEELIINYFSKPNERKEASHFLTTTDIKVHLEDKTKQKLSAKKLGEAFTKLKFERFQKSTNNHRCWVWSVIKTEPIEIEEQSFRAD